MRASVNGHIGREYHGTTHVRRIANLLRDEVILRSVCGRSPGQMWYEFGEDFHTALICDLQLPASTQGTPDR